MRERGRGGECPAARAHAGARPSLASRSSAPTASTAATSSDAGAAAHGAFANWRFTLLSLVVTLVTRSASPESRADR